MKNILTVCTLLALLITQTACDEDSFSQVVEIEIPEHESSIVLNGVWSSQDITLRLLVSSSLGIIGSTEFTYPQDAIVQLYKDGNLTGDLVFNPQNKLYELAFNDILGEEESTYKIEAQFGNLKAVSAEQEMPPKVEIKSVEYEKEGAIGEFGEKMDKHIVSFVDPVGEENYYIVGAFREQKDIIYVEPSQFDTISRFDMIYLEANDPTVSWSRLGLLFSDKAFNGQTYTLRATAYTWWGNPDDESGNIEYRLMSISKDTYLYFKSLAAYEDAQGNPFAEPATVYSNVENGYGLFGLMARDTMVITP